MPAHPNRKNKDAVRVGHPAFVQFLEGGFMLAHPNRKNKDAVRVGHPAQVGRPALFRAPGAIRYSFVYGTYLQPMSCRAGTRESCGLVPGLRRGAAG